MVEVFSVVVVAKEREVDDFADSNFLHKAYKGEWLRLCWPTNAQDHTVNSQWHG